MMGAYQCVCDEGYKQVSFDTKKGNSYCSEFCFEVRVNRTRFLNDQNFKAGSGTNCVDVNECNNGQNGGCDDICVNTPGKIFGPK